jgi:two-component sensor histidine kinase
MKAAFYKREGAWVALGGGLVLCATVINDVTYDFGLTHSRSYSPFGVFAFLISHSYILAIRFSHALSTVERQETELEKTNIYLEKRVEDRTASLNSSVKEKEVLLREIHHRVKNNMQVIVSLLNLQSDETEDKEAQRLLEEGRNRIKSMMMIHEKLYTSDNLAKIDFEDYIKSIASDIFATYGVEKHGVTFVLDASGEALDLDRAVPCGLIINELLSNALKHAFVNNDPGKISVSLARYEQGAYELIVSDNGSGLPKGFDIDKASSLGLRLVKGLVERQLKGHMKVESNGGTKVTIRFS